MATFEEHLRHSKNNLDYLSKINACINDRWDWQVTVCFYIAVHLMNAHIAKKSSMNYLSHKKVEEALNPFTKSASKVDQDTFIAYNKLMQLSRRSRYLLNENFKKEDIKDMTEGSFTHGPHFRKAIANLDIIIDYISKNHEPFGKIDIKCIDMKKVSYKHFNIIQ